MPPDVAGGACERYCTRLDRPGQRCSPGCRARRAPLRETNVLDRGNRRRAAAANVCRLENVYLDAPPAGHDDGRPRRAARGGATGRAVIGNQDGCADAASGAGVSACGAGPAVRVPVPAGRSISGASAGAIDFSNCTAIALVKS